jgi:hypothetical protein
MTEEETYHVNKYRMKAPFGVKLTPQEILNIFGVSHYALRETFINLVQTANTAESVVADCAANVTLEMSADRYSGRMIDVYDVLAGFNITNPGVQHALKKVLMCGQRGHKDVTEDLYDIISALSRA